jgi:uncharacterized transporter YbjL
MEQQQLNDFFRQYWMYILAANFVLGVIFGLIPFFMGRRRGQATLGTAGLIVTPIVGVPSLLLGLLSAAVFTIIIMVRRPGAADSTGE